MRIINKSLQRRIKDSKCNVQISWWVECRSSQLVPAYHSYGMRDYKKVGDKKAHLAFTQMWDTIAPMIMARNPSMTPNLSYCTGDGRKRRFRTLRALWWHHDNRSPSLSWERILLLKWQVCLSTILVWIYWLHMHKFKNVGMAWSEVFGKLVEQRWKDEIKQVVSCISKNRQLN